MLNLAKQYTLPILTCYSLLIATILVTLCSNIYLEHLWNVFELWLTILWMEHYRYEISKILTI